LDAGKRVLIMDSDFDIGGKFRNFDYNPFQYNFSSYATIAGANIVKILPNHPILANVESFVYYWTTFTGLGTNATLIATSDTANTGGMAVPLVTERPAGNGWIVGLNMLPFYRTEVQRSPVWFWNPATNGTTLWTNAVVYLMDLFNFGLHLSISDVTIPCNETTDPSVTGTPIVSGNCSDVTVSFTDIITTGSCPDSFTVTRTWTAFDQCNSTTTIQTIQVVDNIPPVLVLPANAIVSRKSNTSPQVLGFATATDTCDNSTINIQYSDEQQFCGIDRTWTAEDACGNQATGVQKITYDDPICNIINSAPFTRTTFSVMVVVVISVCTYVLTLL